MQEPKQEPPRRKKPAPMPPPGSTRTIGGNIRSERGDRVNPDIAGGPDHGGPR